VTVSGLTFDTGMLIALERRAQRAWNVYREAMRRKVPITVPTAVLVEWWRGRTDARERIRAGLRIEWLSDSLAERAGEALAAVRDATTVDAIVMASAASRGDVVYTGDVNDLERLRAYFRGVRILAV
jgi:predicted nucleic acid-binding protein